MLSGSPTACGCGQGMQAGCRPTRPLPARPPGCDTTCKLTDVDYKVLTAVAHPAASCGEAHHAQGRALLAEGAHRLPPRPCRGEGGGA